MASRETILNAVLALVAQSGNFQTTGRRLRDPENIGPQQSPALFLVEHSEKYHRQASNLPPQRTLEVKAIFYNDVGSDPTSIPATAINDALDQLDVLLASDNPLLGRCTLGGLVYSLMIDGDVIKAPGDVTGKSTAIVPLKIVLP